MQLTPLSRIILVILLIGFVGCATGPTPINPYYEMPPDRLPKAEQDLFNKALGQLKNNHPDDSINLWKRFLENNPRSFKGYNNLGMAHYSNDQLMESINAFETALALEPFDKRIKDNLKRSLRFQVTIQQENKEYEKAIQQLERVKDLTDLPGKEKVALKIETLQDLIFAQVKQANTLEQYEAFLKKYPNNPLNADEARRQIAKLKPQETPMGEFPEMQDEISLAPGERPTRSMQEDFVTEPFSPEITETQPTSPPVQKETIEIVAETQKPDEEEEIPLDIQEEVEDPAMEDVMKEVPEMPTAMKRPKQAEPMTKPAMDPGMEMKREKSTLVTPSKPMVIKRVRIMTRKTPLRVRENPDSKARVVAQIPRGSVVPVFQEEKDWYQIEYQKGKKGWIAKKYSKLAP
ncbi:MAG: SH3 domain-containing protein [Nitrospina sp.]|jgi:Ca-activated chloride channel homolog|nr:SH3 domain-containing protein [Nitrospina sp.]MBT5631600.1 SH3 domain-containing protein [Nitrospina sp.]